MDALDKALARAEQRRRLPPPAARRQIRKRAGVSQAAVASAVGVTREAVTCWESGVRAPRSPYLERYLDVLERLARE